MKQFLKVGELERKSLAEQNSLTLLTESVIKLTLHFLFAMLSRTFANPISISLEQMPLLCI
jgi:hypothetical protein